MLPVFLLTRSQGLCKLYCSLFTPMLERWALMQMLEKIGENVDAALRAAR